MAGYGTLSAAGMALVLALHASGCSAGADGRAALAYTKAVVAYGQGSFDIAARLAEESLSADRRFLPALVLRGKLAYFAGDDNTALAVLRRAVRNSPGAGEALLWLARAFRATGKTDDAIRACERLLASDPNSIAALRMAAGLALDAGDVGAAMAYLNRAADAAAEAGMVFADRAALRWAAADAAGALADIEAALLCLPADSAAQGAAGSLAARIREAAQ